MAIGVLADIAVGILNGVEALFGTAGAAQSNALGPVPSQRILVVSWILLAVSSAAMWRWFWRLFDWSTGLGTVIGVLWILLLFMTLLGTIAALEARKRQTRG